VRFVLAAALISVATPVAAQEVVYPLEIRRLAELARPLRESSALAVSRVHAGVFWTLNDSGDGPYLYATDSTGSVRARFEVTGARNVDWEALALGRCPSEVPSDGQCLFIADTGDNDERRPRVVLYAVPEPDPAAADEDGKGRTAPAQALRLRYEDRPRDAEALVSLPDSALTLITKGRSGPILRYTIPLQAWGEGEWLLERPDTLPIEPQFFAGRWVTGAAVDRAGRRAAVRTYSEIYFFSLGDRWALDGPRCRIGFVEAQGEGVDFLDGGALLLSSERARGAPGTLTVVRCP
jgi:hypothetical protein